LTAVEFPAQGISDGEITLRLLAESDLPALVAALQDPEIPRWTRIPKRYGTAEARDWLAHQQGSRESGEGIDTIIVDAATGELLGGIGVPHVDWDERRCELGYWLAREHRGRGVMQRAIRLMASWILEALPIDRISIMAAVENAPSRAAAERAGFQFEGVLRSYIVFKDGRHDVAMYSLLREDLS
jgi:ribosomal-protein-alanine N-acetyltransferase